MINYPRLGMKVKLNHQGLKMIHGLTSPEEVQAYVEGSTIVGFHYLEVDGPGPTYTIDLDGPLGIYLLTNHDMDEVA